MKRLLVWRAMTMPLLVALAPTIVVTPAVAASEIAASGEKSAAASMASRDADDLADFDRRARMARELGATEVVVTEGLPIAYWELDADDPYPAWFAHHATLFKMFPPAAARPFMDAAYAARVQRIVAQR